MSTIHGKSLDQWYAHCPALKNVVAMQECAWFNPNISSATEGLAHVGLIKEDIQDAAARLRRFAPYFLAAFPETGHNDGILESPLAAVPHLQEWLGQLWDKELQGRLWFKQDSELPISGSIKARGGIYEVLKHAETLALQAGLLSLTDNYAKLAEPEFREFFGQYSVAVGSTGNLGLSIGIMSAKLGFKASVHMSADARQWKKDKLRANGVTVVEYDSDYSKAVKMGREQAAGDPRCHFVDDENSPTLFLGYAVAAHRLAGQLAALDVRVDAEHPLFVYLPCGVGGGPGGVAFGLKMQFGDHVHCIFCEPTHCPSMFLGVATGLQSEVCVQDFGIDNKTAADGLACGRPSGFVGKAMHRLIDGYTTIDDKDLYRLLAASVDNEGLRLEPSSAAGIAGMKHVLDNAGYLQRLGLTPERMAKANHIAWITGGSMVPEAEMQSYIAKGRSLL